MQNLIEAKAIAPVSLVKADKPTSVANVTTTKAVKPAKPAKLAKLATVKTTKPEPVAEKTDSAEQLSATRAERAVAALAVAEYYSGRSLPFKSASDKFSDINLAKPAKASTQRQAALLAVMLAADTAGNIKADGTFTRGGFKLPARLFDPKAKASETRDCQPESGCLSDMLGRVIKHVSGPLSGKAQRDAVYHIDLTLAETELHQLGDKLAKPALARIAALRKAA